MAIEKRDYKYKVVNSDSLEVIAEKHGLKPKREWARKIWLHDNNKQLYNKAKQNGKEKRRYLHVGASKYEFYNHSKWDHDYRAYKDPHQIILYAGEEIYIPNEKPAKVIVINIDDFLEKEYTFEAGYEYDVHVIVDDEFTFSL